MRIGAPATPELTETETGVVEDEEQHVRPGRSRKLSRFWTLLLLAAVIASAGVVADSTAIVRTTTCAWNCSRSTASSSGR